MENYYTFKGQSPENDVSYIFQALGNILLQKCRASMTKLRQQSTGIRAKETDPIWSQVCSSLLHYHIFSSTLTIGNSLLSIPSPSLWEY